MTVHAAMMLAAADAQTQAALAAVMRECLGREVVKLGPGAYDPGGLARQIRDLGTLTVVIEISLTPGRRSEMSGIRLAQGLRRHGFTGTLVVLGFLPREYLARRYPSLAPGTPDMEYLRLPVSAAELSGHLSPRASLTPPEMKEIIRWRSGLQDEWQIWAHTLGNLLQEWPREWDRACRVMRDWSKSIQEFAADQLGSLERLEQTLQGEDVTAIHQALQALERGLNSPPDAAMVAEEPPVAPSQRAPFGCNTVLLADDRGDVGGLGERLRDMGYTVEVAKEPDEALCLLEQWRPYVVLADLNFHTRGQGQKLMKDALALGAIVIGISKAEALPGDLPPGVEDCCGGLRFQDADRVHRIIWQYAASDSPATNK